MSKLLIYIMEFVGREKELHMLNNYFNDVVRGNGRVVLLEGPAGIGKSYLVEKFLRERKDVQILKSRCEQSMQYVPYNAISQALKQYGTLNEIKKNELKRKIENIAKDLYKENKMLFVDEIGYGGGYRLYKELSRRIRGIYFTIREPKRKDVIWLTETKTDKESINPYNLEFEFLMYLQEFLSSKERRLVYIENLNYLIYTVGIERVVEFLHTLRSIAADRHLVIVSGKVEYLSQKERDLIGKLFDDKIVVEWDDKITPPVIVLKDKVEGDGVLKLKDKGAAGENEVYVSPHGIHPTRLDFEIFEKIAEALDNGMDIVIECLNTILHYNDKRDVYIWLKAVRDYAAKRERKVYILEKTPILKDIEFFFDLIDDGKDRMYSSSEFIETPLRFYDVIYNFLHSHSQRKPIILIFEDIQWIDSNSLEIIYYLSRNIVENKIMIVLTYRNEDVAEKKNILDIISKIESEPISKVLRLKPLKKSEIELMLSSMGYDLNSELIYNISEGNPLLAINVANYMAQGGYLPETIRESIERQVDKLKENILNFLRFLSVAGYEVSLEIVKDFYPEYEEFLEDNIFLELKGSKIRFIYPIYREVVYKGISKDTRVEIHRKIGEWAERRGELFMAAYHYYMAKDKRAVKFLKMAAEESTKMLAFKSGIDYLKKALEITIKYRDEDSMGELYENLGEWYVALGEYKNAISMFAKAMRYRPKDAVFLGTQIGMCYRLMGELKKAEDILSEYLKIAKGIHKGRIVGEMGIIEWETGNFNEALKKLKSYLNYAQKYESKLDEIKAYRNIASVYYMMGKYKTALKYANIALSLAEENGNINEIADTYNVIGVVYNHLNNYEEALAYLLKYLEISEKMGNLTFMARAYNNIGVTYEKIGDIKKAEGYHRKAIDIMKKIGNDRLLEIFYNNMAILYSRHGKYSMAVEYMMKSLEIALKLNNKYGTCKRLIYLGDLNFEMGKYMDAMDFYMRAFEIAKENSYTTSLFSLYCSLSRTYIRLKDMAKAKEYLEYASNLRRKVEESYLLVDYYLVNAEYHILINDWDTALNWVEKMKKIADKSGDLFQVLYADMLSSYIDCQKGLCDCKKFNKIINKFSKMDYKVYLGEAYYYYALCLSKSDMKSSKNNLNKAKKVFKSINLEDRVKEIDEKLNEILS